MKELLIPHNNKPRIKTLDSIRGLAALAVVFCHLLAGLFYSRAFELSPFNFLIEGRESVILFFVFEWLCTYLPIRIRPEL
jgi:peptidoglycan/LPS O-acetylase OafA/YrhL